jgi:hypothetical protein
MTTELEQVFQTVDRLNDAELELLRERIERSHPKKSLTHPRGYPEEAAELFAIPFETYRAMSQDERDAVAFRAYKTLDRWIDDELKKRHAKWMLVCGGEILESSPEFLEYPSSDKLIMIGKARGLIPFVFIYTPLIEESSWSALSGSDYYPTLPLIVGKFGTPAEKLASEGVTIQADFDTGSPDLLLDYDQMVSTGVVRAMPIEHAHYRPHLGEYDRAYLLPIVLGVNDHRGQTLTIEFGAILVRNWRQSPLCFVNPDREALAGRNLIHKFPLKVELDGEKKKTKVIGKKATSNKTKQRQ